MSGKVLMALARDNNGDIVNRGGGGILTPITTTQIETNRPGKFGKSIYTNDSTYFTYNLTEALGTSDFTLSYWAKFYNSLYDSKYKKSISIGQYDGEIPYTDGHLEQNSTVYVGTYTCNAYYNDIMRWYGGFRLYVYDKDGSIHVVKNFSRDFGKNAEAEEWHHYAVIRYGEYFLIFCDGKLIYDGYPQYLSQAIHISANDSFDQNTIYIGGPLVSNPGPWLEQDLDDICLIKGEALFIDKSNPTSDFSVPNTYLDVRPQTKKIFYNFRI